MGKQPTDLPDGNLSVRLISADQTFLGAFLEFFDQPFLAQRFAFIATDFGIDQRNSRTGEKEARAFTALMSGEAADGIVADPAVERTVGRANEVDEPGFADGQRRFGGNGGGFARRVHVTIRA
jgi:hypothetical protein